jgi:hypothetical protein
MRLDRLARNVGLLVVTDSSRPVAIFASDREGVRARRIELDAGAGRRFVQAPAGYYLVRVSPGPADPASSLPLEWLIRLDREQPSCRVIGDVKLLIEPDSVTLPQGAPGSPNETTVPVVSATIEDYERFLEHWTRSGKRHIYCHPDEPPDKDHAASPRRGAGREAAAGLAERRRAPVVGIDFFDAWACARFLGRRLPSLAECLGLPVATLPAASSVEEEWTSSRGVGPEASGVAVRVFVPKAASVSGDPGNGRDASPLEPAVNRGFRLLTLPDLMP